MSKKTMLIALAVVSSLLLAVPGFASAKEWHLNATTSFTVHGTGAPNGGTSTLRTSSGLTTHCTTVTGTGNYTTTTTGTVQLLFHGCTGSGFSCGNTATAGTITTNALSFHNAMIATNKPGILITPGGGAGPTPGSGPFATYTCAGGLVKVEIFGNGILGTLENSCGESTTVGKLEFRQKEGTPGTQEHLTYTGATYDLSVRVNSGATHPTASIETTGTVTFPASRTIECTN